MREIYQEPANEIIQSRLTAGGTIRFVVPTGSMSPLLRAGEAVVVRGVPAAEVDVGDLVVMQVGPIWRVHRLVALDRQGDARLIVTKGDNSRVADAPELLSDRVGIVIAVCGPRGDHPLTGRLIRLFGYGTALLSRWQWRLAERGVDRVVLKLFDLVIYAADRAARVVIDVGQRT